MSFNEAALKNKLNTNLTKLDTKITAFENKVSGILDDLPGWLGWLKDKAIDLWNSFVNKMKELWGKVTDAWNNIVWPSELNAPKDTWSNDIGGPVSKISSNADINTTKVDNDWTGDGEQAYEDTLKPQRVAMQNIKSYADTIAKALGDLASAEIIFIGAFIAGLVVFVGCVVGAIISIAGGPTVVAGIAAAAAGAAVFIGAIVGATANLKSAAGTANTSVQNNVVNDWDGFPKQKWPTATIYD